MASELLVAYPLKWPLDAERRRELSVGDVTEFSDRYWLQGSYPPLWNVLDWDEREAQDRDPTYFDERFLYGHIFRKSVFFRIRDRIHPFLHMVFRSPPFINLVFPEEGNDPATFQRLKTIVTETTPSEPELKDPL